MIDSILERRVWTAIIAGGKGTRLFPISYDDCPKQFCQLDERNTFIQATAERFMDLGVLSSHIVVVTTNARQTELAREQLVRRGIISTNIYEIDERFDYAGAMVKAAEFIKNSIPTPSSSTPLPTNTSATRPISTRPSPTPSHTM